MSKLKRIIYLSAVSSLYREASLTEIVTTARDFNARHGVTGVLLFNGVNFLQAIEGDPQTIDTLYRRIKRDDRHTAVHTVSDEYHATRAFEGWSMRLALIPPTADSLRDHVEPAIARPLEHAFDYAQRLFAGPRAPLAPTPPGLSRPS